MGGQCSTVRQCPAFINAISAFLIVMFVAAAVTGLFVPHETVSPATEFLVILVMGVSGLLLILQLLVKLGRENRLSRSAQSARDQMATQMAAFELSVDGIAIADEDGKLSYLNESFAHLYGYSSPAELTGQPWHVLYRADEQMRFRAEIFPMLSGSHRWKGMCHGQTKKGHDLPQDVSLTRTEDGQTVFVVRDLSEKMKDEEEKDDLRAQFYQAQKMEALGRMAGGIAHDFNNILSSVLGYAEFLVEDLPQETDPHFYARQIIIGSQQAKQLVEQILTFSRRSSSVQEQVDLVPAVTESLAMLKASFPSTINICPSVLMEHAPILGNATQIHQAIMNLYVNAKDAMEDESGTLDVILQPLDPSFPALEDMEVDSLSDEPDTGVSMIHRLGAYRFCLQVGQIAKDRDYICLTIADSGSGMDRQVMEHIFEPFFTTKDVHKGTGLGLASVHGVILNHKGALVVDTEIGKGTRFHLLFPMEEEVNYCVLEQKKEMHVGQGTIMLVDDQISVLDMTSRMLERLGYDVVSCCSADEVLEALSEDASFCDLILTDQTMPGMTGKALAEEVSTQWPDIPVMLMTGHSTETLENAVDEIPALKAVLAKPLDKSTLTSLIAQHALKRAGDAAA